MSNKNPVHEFLRIKEKVAGFFGSLKSHLSGEALGGFVAPAIAASGVAATGLGLKAGYDLIREKLTRQRDYKAMIEANPSLRDRDARMVNMVYSSLRRLSPTMAADPLVAGSFVRKHVELAPDSGVTIEFSTAKAVAETQKNIQQAKSSRTSVYEAMLGGLGRQMQGVSTTYGPKGPTVSGPGAMARREARKMGLPLGPVSEGLQYTGGPSGMSARGSKEDVERFISEQGLTGGSMVGGRRK